MAIKKECPEKYDWWLNELESLGVSVKVLNDLNNIQEVSELTENLKQTFYQEYKTTYSEWICYWQNSSTFITPQGGRYLMNV